MSQKRYLEPLTYEVGKDIPEERYHEALQKIADWFAESRRTREPAALARQLVQECLDGKKKDGQKWFGGASLSLVKRIRMKCRFDIETMLPLRTGTEKTKRRKEQERARLERKRKELADDNHIPDEIRKNLQPDVKYGDDPHVFLSSAEEVRWQELKANYIKQFPELATVNAEAELHLLLDIHVLTERHRLNILSGKRENFWEADTAAKLESLKKALGIHPDQLAKRVKEKADMSIAAAAARLEAMPNFRQLRERFWIEELLQLWQMYMSPTADGLTYQLDEIGLFGLTRSKPSKCPKCHHRVFAGLSIDEIEEYLKRKGVLKRVEPEGGRPTEPDASIRSEDQTGGKSPVEAEPARLPGA